MNKPPRKRKKSTSAASSDPTPAANSANEDISLQENPASAIMFLEMLGKPKRYYLTDLEEKLLTVLELEIRE